MSSLIFYTDPEQILVATDTLAVQPGGEPLLFCSKAIYLPHLRTIIAGTGMGGFSGDWAMSVNNRMVLRGIQNLDYHTPKALRERWQAYKAEFSLADDATTTIYHFGLSEDDQSVISYAYRSTNDFTSEHIGYGTGMKPACTAPESGNFIDHLHAMMKEQRAIQATVEASKRIHIGGEAIAMHLTREGCTVFTAFQFEDFQEQLQQIFCNYR